MKSMDGNNIRKQRSGGVSRWSVALVLFLLIASFYLVAEHWAHAWFILPWLLLLACPLLHFWHHGGHGSHDRASASEAEDQGKHQH